MAYYNQTPSSAGYFVPESGLFQAVMLSGETEKFQGGRGEGSKSDKNS